MAHSQDTTLSTTTDTSQAMTAAPVTFDRLVNMIAPDSERAAGIVAASSARVYRDTYTRWATWAADQGLDALDVNYNTVSAYLSDRDTTKASKQRELSALRTLAKTLSIVDFNNAVRKAAYESLQLLKVRATGDGKQHERARRALTPAEADRLLRVWAGDDTPLGLRNRALIVVLLLAGLRVSEAVALTWQDVDFDHGVIKVRHGKGDKYREAALYGSGSLDALRAWHMAQPAGYAHLFVSLRRGGHFCGDTPMSTVAAWGIVTATADRAGIGHVKPHDLRRSLATELLETGSPVHHVQTQLGHSDSSTTLNNYAVSVDARQRRKTGRVRFG